MILAEKIALLRRQNGWSQEELADQLNVSRQAVSKWEGGTSIPDLDKILKLSALFEVSTDYLLKDELEQPDATAPLPKEERVTEPCRTVSFDEANAYLSTVQAVHGKMAAGVGLCILSPITLLVLGAWSDGTPNEERMAGLGVIVLLLFVALGLLLILPAAIRLEAFEYLEKEQIALAYGVEGIVERQKQEYAPTYRRSMTQGVVLCVLAVVPILGTAMLGAPGFWVAAAVGLLLAIVAGAVQLFIRAGMTQGSFDKLLQTPRGGATIRGPRKVDEPPCRLVCRGLLVPCNGGVPRCQLLEQQLGKELDHLGRGRACLRRPLLCRPCVGRPKKSVNEQRRSPGHGKAALFI